MRSKFAVAAVALSLVAAASRVIANPVGVPPTAKPFDVIEGKTISIELGTPTAHGWYVLIWGSYKVGDQEFLANGAAREGEFNPGAGCVYIALPPRWKLLEPLEAVCGMLMFGVSTAFIFAVIQRLIHARFEGADNVLL